MNKNKRPVLSKFRSYDEEAEFWDTHSITDLLGEMEPVDLVYSPTTKKEEVVHVRMSPETKKVVKAIAKERHRSVSDLLRLWVEIKVSERLKVSKNSKTHSKKAAQAN